MTPTPGLHFPRCRAMWFSLSHPLFGRSKPSERVCVRACTSPCKWILPPPPLTDRLGSVATSYSVSWFTWTKGRRGRLPSPLHCRQGDEAPPPHLAFRSGVDYPMPAADTQLVMWELDLPHSISNAFETEVEDGREQARVLPSPSFPCLCACVSWTLTPNPRTR